MKSTFRFTLLLLAFIVTVSACKKSVPKQTKYIPKDALMVFSASPANFRDKLVNSNIKWDSIFQSITSEMSESSNLDTKQKWEDFKNAGIDFSADFYVFLATKGSIVNGRNNALGIVALLKDANAFETFIKKEKPDVTIKKGSNYSYAALGDDYVAGWSNDVLIISRVSNGNTAEGTYNTGEGTSSQKQLTALFNQSESESVASISEFRDLSLQKADVLFWSNSSSTINSMPYIGLTKAADLLKDLYSASTLNFVDGKIVANSVSYVGKDLRGIMKKYAGPSVDLELVEKYPSSINGFAAFSFDPKLINEVVKFIGFEATINQFLTQMGFSLEDIIKAFKGDFAVVFSDFGIVAKANPYLPGQNIKSPVAKIIIDAKIGDKEAYKKLTSKLAEKNILIENKNGYTISHQNNIGYSFSLDDKNLLVSNDSILAEQYKVGNKGKAAIPADIKDFCKGKSVAFYFDLNAILKVIPNDSASQHSLDAAKASFKDLVFTSDNFDGKSIKGQFELRTIHAKENSLVTLLKFLTTISKDVKQSIKVRDTSIDEMPDISNVKPLTPPPSTKK